MEQLIIKAKELYQLAKTYNNLDELDTCFYKWVGFYHAHTSLQNRFIKDDYTALSNVIFHISFGTTESIIDKEELKILNEIIS